MFACFQGELDDEDVLLEKHRNSISEEEEMDESHVVESAAGFNIKVNENNKEMSLDKAKKGVTSRKYCCEKCSYCSASREHFRRHMNLHGSKQG